MAPSTSSTPSHPWMGGFQGILLWPSGFFLSLKPCFGGLLKLLSGLVSCQRTPALQNSDGGVWAEFSYSDEDQLRSDNETKTPKFMRHFVSNGRLESHALEQDGFTLASIDFKKTSGVDLYDPQKAYEVLYPIAAEALETAYPGATRILVFDHLVRNTERSPENTPLLASGPVYGVHGDYTVRSGYTRARSLLEPWESEERIEEALKGRFIFVNVWVPLEEVKRDPLAAICWDSQKPRDVVNLSLHFKHRVGEIYRVLPSKDHRWVYYPDMQPGECMLLKVFDSSPDVARFSLHAAFQDPTSPADAPTRKSIEVRTIVFLDALPADFAKGFIAPHLQPDSPDADLKPLKVEAGPVSDEW